jgi:hypothetical protein
VLQERGEIVERVRSRKFGGVDQGHEDVADEGTVLGLVEEGVLPVQDCLLQCPFTDVMPTPGLCRVSGAYSPPMAEIMAP